MPLFRIAAVIFSLFLPLRQVSAQDLSDFHVTNYNSDNGLPQTSVGQMAMDKNGFLWLTTQGGLVRFDGEQFVTYNRLNVPSLTSNRILKVGLRSDSIVYFSDENAKLYSFDSQNRVIRLPFHDFNKAIVVKSLLDHFDIIKNLDEPDRKRVESVIPPSQTVIRYLPINNGEGYLWIHSKMAFYLSGKKIKFSINLSENKKGRLMSNFGVFDHNLYCMNADSRLIKIDRNGVQTEFFLQVWDKGQWRDEPASGVLLYQTPAYLVMFSKGMFYKVVRAEGNILFCLPLLDSGNQHNVNSYYYFPRQGIHVVGSATKGILIFKPKQFRTGGIPGTDNIYYGQARHSKNAVLTSLGVVPSSQPLQNSPFPLTRQGAILREPDGRYWVTSKEEGVFCLDSNLQVLKRLKGKVEARVFRRTPDGNIWLSTFNKQFGRISGDSVIWSKVKIATWRPNFIPFGNHVFWIADGREPFQYNALSGEKTAIKSLAGKEIREFYFDKRKTLWLGTYGDGFYAMRNGKLTRLPEDRNGFLLFVHSFLEDSRGFMWMSTNHGLFKCKVQDLYDYLDRKTASIYYHYYDKTNGFNTNEFNGGYPPSGIVLRDGQFSFPSMDGLVQFHPDSIRDILPSSGIFIDYLRIDGKELPSNHNIILEPSAERMEFKVVSPYFGNPENQLLEYNVEGMGDQWYPVNANGLIVLNRPVHGDYALRVRKKAGFGRNNVKMLVKKISVRPFWYQTWYFRIFAFLLAILTVYALMRARYFYLTSLKKLLEKEVKERTRQLEYSNRLKQKITMLLAHDLQSPIHFLSMLSEHVSMAADKKQFQEVKRGTDEIRGAAWKMHAFVKEINLWTRSQQEGFHIAKRPVDFDGLMEEIGEFFTEMLAVTQNRLEVRNPDGFQLLTNGEILKAVVRNLIDNSNKHAANGKILVSLQKQEDGFASLTVSDNGKGMFPADVSRINRRIANVMTSEGIEQSGRLGYQIIIDFVTLLQCRLEVHSKRGQGTTVRISGIPTINREIQKKNATDHENTPVF